MTRGEEKHDFDLRRRDRTRRERSRGTRSTEKKGERETGKERVRTGGFMFSFFFPFRTLLKSKAEKDDIDVNYRHDWSKLATYETSHDGDGDDG